MALTGPPRPARVGVSREGEPSGGGSSSHASRTRRLLAPSWAGRQFTILFWARVSMSAARALAGVLVPVYLALQGFTGLSLGVLFFAVAIFAALLSSGIGLASDRMGRKKFLVVVPLLAAAAAAVFAVTTWIPALFVMAVLGSFGRGAGAGAGMVGPYQPVESALVTEVTPGNRRNDAFGRLAFASSLGALAGTLTAIMVNGHHDHGAAALVAFRPGFVAAAVLAALAGLIALALEEQSGASRHREHGMAVAEPAALSAITTSVETAELAVDVDNARGTTARGARRGIHFPHRSRWLLYRLWWTNGVNGLAIGMFGPFVTYWLYQRYGVGVAEIGILYSVINAATMPSTLSAAGLARRFGLVRTVTAVRFVQAVLIVPMVLAPSFAVAGALYLLRMVAQRIGLPLRQSYVLAMADPGERASVAALSNLPAQAAMATSPVLSGYLFDSVSLELPFEIAAVLQLANTALFWIFFRNAAPEEERGQAP